MKWVRVKPNGNDQARTPSMVSNHAASALFRCFAGPMGTPTPYSINQHTINKNMHHASSSPSDVFAFIFLLYSFSVLNTPWDICFFLVLMTSWSLLCEKRLQPLMIWAFKTHYMYLLRGDLRICLFDYFRVIALLLLQTYIVRYS